MGIVRGMTFATTIGTALGDELRAAPPVKRGRTAELVSAVRLLLFFGVMIAGIVTLATTSLSGLYLLWAVLGATVIIVSAHAALSAGAWTYNLVIRVPFAAFSLWFFGSMLGLLAQPPFWLIAGVTMYASIMVLTLVSFSVLVILSANFRRALLASSDEAQ